MSVRLAKFFSTEIISADSRQFYRKLTIGTAKPGIAEQDGIVHHFIDHLDPGELYDIGKFESEALATLEKIFLQNDNAIMTGGSGLYIQAVCYGLDELPERDPDLRATLEDALEKEGIEVLQAMLLKLDPAYYQTVDLRNPQRLIRAIEVCMKSDVPYSSLRTSKSVVRDFRIIMIGLDIPREILYERINRRVDEMMKQGLLEEVQSLLPFRNSNSMQTVGYRELLEFIDEKISLEDAVELIKRNTRRYAKRQMTWFRKVPSIQWFNYDDTESIIRHIQKETGIQK